MAQQTCMNCGNSYDNAFKVSFNNQDYTFDCFECAINKLAPSCFNCGTKIIGHGLQANSRLFCCGHCAKMAGEVDLTDRAG